MAYYRENWWERSSLHEKRRMPCIERSKPKKSSIRSQTARQSRRLRKLDNEGKATSREKTVSCLCCSILSCFTFNVSYHEKGQIWASVWNGTLFPIQIMSSKSRHRFHPSKPAGGRKEDCDKRQRIYQKNGRHTSTSCPTIPKSRRTRWIQLERKKEFTTWSSLGEGSLASSSITCVMHASKIPIDCASWCICRLVSIADKSSKRGYPWLLLVPCETKEKRKESSTDNVVL